MADTHKTTYVIDRSTDPNEDLEERYRLKGFLSSCDYCKTCESTTVGENTKQSNSDGTVSGGLFKNGEADIKFYPHVHDQYQNNSYVARSTIVNGNLYRGGFGDGDLVNPDWVDAGGFFWKRRTPFFSVSPDASGTDFCNFLMKVDFTTDFDNQMLNFFGGGSDRLIFLGLSRDTDFLSNSQGFPCNWPLRKPQYFLFDERTGTSIESMDHSLLDRQENKGAFYFWAKTYDVFWLEVWEYAARGQVNSDLNTLSDGNRGMRRVNKIHSISNKMSSWGWSNPLAGGKYHRNTWGKNDVFMVALGINFLSTQVDSSWRNVGQYAVGSAPTSGSTNDFRNDQDIGFSAGEELLMFSPNLGQHSKFELNYGTVDPINADWVRGYSLDPYLQYPSTHNSVNIKISKHLAVMPGFEFGTGVSPGDSSVGNPEVGEKYPYEDYGIAPYGTMEEYVSNPGRNVTAVNTSYEEAKLPFPNPYGPNAGTEGEFLKNFTSGEESAGNKYTEKGTLLAGTLPVGQDAGEASTRSNDIALSSETHSSNREDPDSLTEREDNQVIEVDKSMESLNVSVSREGIPSAETKQTTGQ